MKEKEFKLSEKVKTFYYEPPTNAINVKDVKEFIRRLKEEGGLTSQELGVLVINVEKIDKLAGEELVR